MHEAIATDTRTLEQLSEALADVFRTGRIGDVFTDDVFLDGHPPLWRFQLSGIASFAEWLRGYVPHGEHVTVVRTIRTESGFVTEHSVATERDGRTVTSRELLLCEVRDGRISELTVFCDGEWDAELRARHAAEAPMLRP